MIQAVEAIHLCKSYGAKHAVNDLSFSVHGGEILGMIGPNGAGKTTTIRMIMEIISPDTGEVKILGTKWRAETRKQLGYLPEERGLYRKLTVIDCITYLGSLLGMDRRPLLGKAEELLERTGMLPRKNDRIETLSRGMGQIIQFIVAILHDPEIVILDEPFANLDPLNTELLKNMLRELKGGGKAIILSTHAMADVEELCDRVLMIHNGRAILYGGLAEIRSRHGGKPKLVEVPSRSLNEIFIKVLEESHE